VLTVPVQALNVLVLVEWRCAWTLEVLVPCVLTTPVFPVSMLSHPQHD
jgi:hypothetical protein